MTTNKNLNTQTNITETNQTMVNNMNQDKTDKNQPEKLDRLIEAGSNPARSTTIPFLKSNRLSFSLHLMINTSFCKKASILFQQ
jgi:hypothetical protein